MQKILQTEGTFDDLILKELKTEGYSGEELVEEFKIRKAKVRPAIEQMLAEAKKMSEETVKK